MYHGDRARKQVLVEHGFRLPSCLDNRPLRFEEWEARLYQVIYTSATPGPYETTRARQTVEQIIRPTGLVDPEVVVRPTRGQIDDLVTELQQRIKKGQRALVTTLTKRMAEDLADYLTDLGLNVHYLHSEVDTFERVDILQDLRAGVYDAVVGINLLREGLDLPEVSLVAILDADKEGFLRSETALIQTIGRAARHFEGTVVMYADHVTASMQRAIDETNRRREKQMAYNQAHNITPRSVVKALTEMLPHAPANGKAETPSLTPGQAGLSPDEYLAAVAELEAEMRKFAEALEFEKAAEVRDRIAVLREQLEMT
jgi:excinuclease ABC subunit B